LIICLILFLNMKELQCNPSCMMQFLFSMPLILQLVNEFLMIFFLIRFQYKIPVKHIVVQFGIYKDDSGIFW
jgi:hypothetical protein